MKTPYPKYKGGVAIHWDWYAKNTHRYSELMDTVLKVFKQELGSVLDIGSGDGLVDWLLTEKYQMSVTGIEPDKDGLAIAFAKVKYRYLLETTIEKYTSVAMLPVDYMLSVNTIEHVDDPTAFVRVMKSVRKFGVVVTDNATMHKQIDKYHTREFNYQELKELFKDFKTEYLETGNPIFIAIKIYANS